jgi:hypothetical protein
MIVLGRQVQPAMLQRQRAYAGDDPSDERRRQEKGARSRAAHRRPQGGNQVLLRADQRAPQIDKELLKETRL